MNRGRAAVAVPLRPRFKLKGNLAPQTCFPGQTTLRKVEGIWVLECEHDEGSCGGHRERGEEIPLDPGGRFRVLDVVPFEEEDESPFVGLLQVEAAY